MLISESTTAEIKSEQNLENNNERFKILKNKVKFELYMLTNDKIIVFNIVNIVIFSVALD